MEMLTVEKSQKLLNQTQKEIKVQEDEFKVKQQSKKDTEDIVFILDTLE